MSDDTSTRGVSAELRRRFAAAISLAVLNAVLLVGCGDGLPTAQDSLQETTSVEDTDTVDVPMTVTRTDPAAAEQGQTWPCTFTARDSVRTASLPAGSGTANRTRSSWSVKSPSSAKAS